MDVNVASLDETMALVQELGGSVVRPKTAVPTIAWVTIVADPLWTEQFMAIGLPVYTGELIPPKLAELLSIALDASYTRMYAPWARRHIKAALKLGATMVEIMEVLKLCVVAGVQAFNLGVPILKEELLRETTSRKVG